jgi:hypothetical protein
VVVKVLVITGGPGTTANVSAALPVPPAFVALTVKPVVPVEVGVPLINPVEAFTLSHDGTPLAPKLVGELLAVI